MKNEVKLPEAFKKNMLDMLGETEAELFFNSLEEKEATSVRVNSRDLGKVEIIGEPVPWEQNGYYLDERPNFALDPAWHSGAYYVQESSSMITGDIVKQLFDNKSIIALDISAAPGGKSTHLLDVLPSESLLVSNEIISKRNKILIENIEKWGNSYNIVTQASAQDYLPLENFFDLVVVDAPCSGEGLFRKQKEAISEWSEQNVEICSNRQTDILQHTQSTLKVGGYLCYSTCTFEVSENEQQIQNLIDSGLFELVPIDHSTWEGIQAGLIPGTVRCWPHKTRGSGFFIALLKKVKESPIRENQHKMRRWNWKELRDTHKSPYEFIVLDEKHSLFSSGDYVKIFPTKYKSQLNQIASYAPVTHFGINAGQFKKDLFIPAHGLIHSKFVEPQTPVYKTDDKELALTFLRKQNIPIQPELENGWAVFQWKQHSLGWIKQNKQRVNNYLPNNLILRS